MLCQQNHFCHFSWTVVFLTAFLVQTRCAWIKVPLLAGRVTFCCQSFSKRGIYSHQITLNLFYTWTNIWYQHITEMPPGSLYPIIEIIRLLGRPQPQMYPPVALNQYTWVNRTHRHFLYMLQGPMEILRYEVLYERF